MKDIVYIYNKIDFTRKELGEIQVGFNFSFVIDGTKDSAKILVHNYDDEEIEPYSIIKHKATNTWWIVSHDRVDRYENEDKVIEDNVIPTYRYVHELELVGAIELLNARDLTDCGFNQNRYNVRQVIEKILKLSTFEFNKTSQFTISTNAIDLDKNVDYVKTFENYTPLSAIREFIDGYNCDIKLEFIENGIGTIIGATFTIISKTGNQYGDIYTEEDFNKVEQVKTIDQDSFGTSVVSNAENVISTKTKTYPSSGGVRITGTSYNIEGGDNNTACLRLPSNVFKVNWVDMYRKCPINIFYAGSKIKTIYYYSNNDNSINNAYQEILDVLANYNLDTIFSQEFPKYRMREYGKLRFYYTDKYDAINDKFTCEHYIPIRITLGGYGVERQTVLSNIDLKKNVSNVDDVFCFERGKDVINNFTFFTNSGGVGYRKNEAFFKPIGNEIIFDYLPQSGINETYIIMGDYNEQTGRPTNQSYYLPELNFVINYIPMSDIKIKVDNTLERRDSKHYNQNGKLTDSNALSKLLLSYSKEIESNNITKNAIYYYTYNNGVITSNIPSVGSLVAINNQTYVINNVSMTFTKNETENYGTEICGYMVICEFTLSKNVAVKSLMTNPNTNIRDYGIPQNNNVERKQLYRDFYELSYTYNNSQDTPYLTLDKVLNIGNQYSPYQEHSAIIKLGYKGAYGGNDEIDPKNIWYYQLESTTFIMKKSVYEVFNFKDNNIIGYGSQNVWSGFDIKRIITGNFDLANTPISYVDENGEVEGISIALCTNEEITSIYADYISASGSESSDYNAFYSCFIPEQIYEGGNVENQDTPPVTTSIVGAKDKCDFSIIELDYQKDALEVPVFEYSCQIDDSDKVIVGSNILDTFDLDRGYMYSYIFVDKNKYNDNNYSLKKNEISTPTIDENNVATISNAVKMEYDNNKVKITLWETCTIDFTKPIDNITNPIYSTQKSFDTTKDLMIVRSRILEEDLIRDIVGELITNNVVNELPIITSDYYNKYVVKNNDNYYLCKLDNATHGDLYDTRKYEDDLNLPLASLEHVGKQIAVKNYYSDTPYCTFTHDNTTITYSIGGNTYPTTVAQATLRYQYDIIAHLQEVGRITGTGYDDGTDYEVVYENNNYYFDVQTVYATVINVEPSGSTGVVTNVTVNSSEPHKVHIFFRVTSNVGPAEQVYVRFRIDINIQSSSGNSRDITIQGSTLTSPQVYTVDNPNYEVITGIAEISKSIVSTPSDYFLYVYNGGGAWSNTNISVTSLTNADKFYYNNNNYIWANNQWEEHSNYQWVEIDNASGKYFTYQNDILRYNSIINGFEEITGNINNRQDLMFICRDINEATITNGALFLEINYYKTH